MNYDYEMDLAHYDDLEDVKEGDVAIPVSGFRILRYLNQDGQECIVYRCDGEALLPRTLGMLEWAKLSLVSNAYDPTGDSDE